MSVTIKEKDLLFIIVNVMGILTYIASYVVYFLLTAWGNQVKESLDCCPGLSGKWIAILFANAGLQGVFAFIIIIMVLTDIWWIVRKHNERNKGWL